ncbi:MAG: rRNA maturation RNase YbeY [Cyanobacteria bacterium P01_D01_bin.73]
MPAIHARPVLIMAIAPSNLQLTTHPVAMTLQQEDGQASGSMPALSVWQGWFDDWWQDLGAGESEAELERDLPYLAPLLAVYPKSSLAIALNLRLTTDSGIHQLNRDYRGIDRPTDVLAFSALEASPPAILVAQMAAEEMEAGDDSPGETSPEPIELGDLAISLNTAERQAQRWGHSLSLELAWLAAHGLLHLLGWDHGDRLHLEEMLTRQQTLLTAANLGKVNWGALDMTDLGYEPC